MKTAAALLALCFLLAVGWLEPLPGNAGAEVPQ